MNKIALYILCFLVCFNGFSQRNPAHRNSFKLQIGGDTPYVGMAYQRNVWRDSTAKHQVDVGAGIGWTPIIFRYDNARQYTLSHQVSYKRILNKYLDATLGYSGIIADKGNPFGNRMTYYPMLQAGGNIHLFRRIAFGGNISMLYNESETTELHNETELYKTIQTHILIYPALYLSINF